MSAKQGDDDSMFRRIQLLFGVDRIFAGQDPKFFILCRKSISYRIRNIYLKVTIFHSPQVYVSGVLFRNKTL